MQHVAPVESLWRAAKMAAAKWRCYDPAISREDIAQAVFCWLWERLKRGEPITPELAAWLATHSSRDVVLTRSVRRRCRQSELSEAAAGQHQASDRVLAEVIAREVWEVIRTTRLSRMQRAVIDGLLDGDTPSEIATRLGTSLSSVSNALKAAILAIRRELGVPEHLPVRLGRCKAADRNVAPNERRCEICGEEVGAKRADAKYCSGRCRQKARRESVLQFQEVSNDNENRVN